MFLRVFFKYKWQNKLSLFRHCYIHHHLHYNNDTSDCMNAALFIKIHDSEIAVMVIEAYP